MIEKTAAFLLNVPPIDEISDDLCEVVEKFRYNLLTKKEAMKIVVQLFPDSNFFAFKLFKKKEDSLKME
jgi:hypothetical protein